jgi:hypothetical protein
VRLAGERVITTIEPSLVRDGDAWYIENPLEEPV